MSLWKIVNYGFSTCVLWYCSAYCCLICWKYFSQWTCYLFLEPFVPWRSLNLYCGFDWTINCSPDATAVLCWHFPPPPQAIIQWSGTPSAPGVLSWQELLAVGRQEPQDALLHCLSLQAVNQCCTLIYTSGKFDVTSLFPCFFICSNKIYNLLNRFCESLKLCRL